MVVWAYAAKALPRRNLLMAQLPHLAVLRILLPVSRLRKKFDRWAGLAL